MKKHLHSLWKKTTAMSLALLSAAGLLSGCGSSGQASDGGASSGDAFQIAYVSAVPFEDGGWGTNCHEGFQAAVAQFDNVKTYEVENVLMEHPAVVECSVIGVPDTLRGQAIKAFVVLTGGKKPSAELEKEIKDFCNSRLAEYKWIRLVEFVREMPKTISGKIRKTELKKASGQ